MPFDSLAATYDDAFGTSPLGRLFRFRLAERVMSQAPPPARVLDIGCGTGEDALWLARQGYVVHGIDESSGMIEMAQAKAVRSASSATFQCRSLQNLSRTDAKFDAVISNFGALNCVSLATWTDVVPRLLRPSGRAFVVLMGRSPLPESLRRGFTAANRGRTAQVRIGSGAVTVHYEPATMVKEALARTATVDRVEAMGCLVPGPGFVGFARRHPIAVGLLAMGETVVRSAPFFRNRGDHTLFEFSAR